MLNCSGVKYPLPPAVVRCTAPFGADAFAVVVGIADGPRDDVIRGCEVGKEVGAGAVRVPLVPLGAEDVAFCWLNICCCCCC